MKKLHFGRVRIRVAFILAYLFTLDARAELNDCRQLGGGLTEHSCFHTDFGPFVEVRAVPRGVPLEQAPAINKVHTHYTVQLGTAGVGVVRYEPKRSGPWALFSTSGTTFELYDERGTATPAVLEHDVSTCSALPKVQVFDLSSAQSYAVTVTAQGHSSAALVLENVEEFEVDYGPDRDGDGFAGNSDVVTTSCTPPQGYVAELGDCNDDDAETNPQAVEVCDGIDNNCDGLIDEEDETVQCDEEDGEHDAVAGQGCECHSVHTNEAWPALLVLFVLGARRRR